MDNGSRYNVLYDDKEEETLEDINAGENEQISTMHSGPGIDLHMKEGEPSNPIQVEKPVAAKDIRPSLQVQKRVLKTGAGKNPQTHKKGLSFNLGPLKTRKATKPKLKEAEKKVIDIKKSLGVAQPSASASRNFKMVTKEQEMLESMRRLQREQLQLVDFNTQSEKFMEAHIVKNAFFNHGESSSRAENHLSHKEDPPPDKPWVPLLPKGSLHHGEDNQKLTNPFDSGEKAKAMC
ncbi:hypothetical protein S83_052045 [Arachis hypogaea]